MLTTFYLDKELFDDDSLQNINQLNLTILNNWKNYGCLGVCEDSKLDLIKAIKKVPVKYSIQWQTALTNYKSTPICPRKSTISDCENFVELKEILVAEEVLTGVIPTDYSSDFINLKNSDCFEVVTPSNFEESQNFQNSETYCLTQIAKGDDINVIWQERLHNLARYSKQITIIDRFSALNILEDHSKGLKTSLETFIEYLSLTGKKYEISIFGACDINGRMTNATTLKTYLNNVLRKKPLYTQVIEKCNFSLCKNGFFGKEAHDRMLKFDKHVIEIGNGLDIFRQKPILNNTFTIKLSHQTNFDSVYNTLSKNREPGCANL